MRFTQSIIFVLASVAGLASAQCLCMLDNGASYDAAADEQCCIAAGAEYTARGCLMPGSTDAEWETYYACCQAIEGTTADGRVECLA